MPRVRLATAGGDPPPMSGRCATAERHVCHAAKGFGLAGVEQLPGWIALGPKDLAFFFQTNQVSRRMEFSIASVRRHFPEAPFYLISDGGPSFQSLAEKWTIHAFRAEMPMHLAQYMNANFTCHRHLLRLADAARWAREQGAKYLMIWEEDTRMLRPLRGLPDVDLATQGNIANTHLGLFTARTAGSPQPGDPRRKRQAERYAARNGYSAGPGSVFKITTFLSALEKSEDSDLEEMYPVQDMCWEDFALSANLSVKRNPEDQQITGLFGDLDAALLPPPGRKPDAALRGKPDESVDVERNLQCLGCLDSCKVRCACGPSWSWSDRFLYLKAQVPQLWNRPWSIWRQSQLLWDRPCEDCHVGFACWDSCRDGCLSLCPAVVHPHKGTTLDCEKEPLPARTVRWDENAELGWQGDGAKMVDLIWSINTM
ncbi:unnamed protein product [Durusdinium trenchii]|uniref:4Fe-4S ferredoxin-type domain-containing protein n=1 Tax=Durusdinium trenchii TaxID=1381693 RepID=A0ABP0NJC0_9DINO